jgi:hypothetical protein
MNALTGGLVPNLGLEHLVVGRERETKALIRDTDSVKEGGASFRAIIGENGAGKTFTLRQLQSRAVQENFVVVSADLSVNHRLHATDGRARALYSSLMANVCTKSCPSGNGLRPLLESWLSGLAFESGTQAAPEAMTEKINQQLRALKDFPAGFDFATVLARYYEGYANDNTALQDAALRWLRAEYSTKTESRLDLGVRRIIGDEDIYAALKLFAAFCRLAGYNGLIVMLDELSVLTHRLSLARARESNARVLLTIINECFQAGVSGLGVVVAGTPDSLTDPERGLFTVPALRTRLRTCAPAGCFDPGSPVIQLEPLGREELHMLLFNVRHVCALGDESQYRLPDAAVERFLYRALTRMGRTVVTNPRDVLRPFVSILNILAQEPDRQWEELVEKTLAAAPSDSAESQLGNFKVK